MSAKNVTSVCPTLKVCSPFLGENSIYFYYFVFILNYPDAVIYGLKILQTVLGIMKIFLREGQTEIYWY